MKKYGNNISEEMLNALVDQEFSPGERAEMLQQIRDDAEAAAELCRLRDLKEMVGVAYAEPPQPKTDLRTREYARAPWAVAAVLVLLVGATVVLQHTTPDLSWSGTERLVVLDPLGRGQRPAVAADQELRVVFHVQNMSQVSSGELLNEVESLLVEFRERKQPVRVEVVAHGGGLGLLRSKLTTERARIARMVKDYPALTFVACRNTIDRLKVEQGIEVVLLPEAVTTESGVAHLVRRQREGWVYIQV